MDAAHPGGAHEAASDEKRAEAHSTFSAVIDAGRALNVDGLLIAGDFNALVDAGDLSALRYDYPLVLSDAVRPVRSLSGVVDEILETAPEADRDRLARHAFRIEREIRSNLKATKPLGPRPVTRT